MPFLQSQYLPKMESIFLIGSFGASSVLIYGAISKPFGTTPQFNWRSRYIGHYWCYHLQKACPDVIWLTAPLAVSLSIVFMQYTKTLHPPGGATALIAVIGSRKNKSIGLHICTLARFYRHTYTFYNCSNI